MDYQFTIGADPEVFLVDPEGNYKCAHGVIPGTKWDPYPVKKGAIQVDGVALEFNIHPAKTAMEFVGNIKSVMGDMTREYKKLAPDLKIKINPTATFDREYFDQLPEEPKLLGCTPDYNAYTQKENDPPETTEPFRTGGGHIHIGGFGPTENTVEANKKHWEECVSMVKQLDAVLFPASILWDSDQKRRSLYGKIGAFRPKSYGVEYRPLSNAFLSRVLTQKFIFDATQRSADLLFNMSTKIYNDDFAEQMVDDIRTGRPLEKADVRYYNRHLNQKYAIPLYL